MAKATPIQVEVDTEKLTELLNPLVEEINALRARVAVLEKFVGDLTEDTLTHISIMDEINPTGQW